jgi:hypothetical protein
MGRGDCCPLIRAQPCDDAEYLTDASGGGLVEARGVHYSPGFGAAW